MLMDLVATVTLIVTIASLIAASTPTPKDDAMMAKFYKFIDMLALNIGKAKDKGNV
jgi:hypothetical protein|tara:strand:+ start:424 stop:591 length:168 start_codon:yes stop_codon:yes gene_type:complete